MNKNEQEPGFKLDIKCRGLFNTEGPLNSASVLLGKTGNVSLSVGLEKSPCRVFLIALRGGDFFIEWSESEEK